MITAMRTFEQVKQEVLDYAKSKLPNENMSYIERHLCTELERLRWDFEGDWPSHPKFNVILDEDVKKCREVIDNWDSLYLTPNNVKVGMGAHILLYTDRVPVTIIKVTPKTIVVQHDRVIVDEPPKQWGDQPKTHFVKDECGSTERYHWCEKRLTYGDRSRGNCICLAKRIYYRDPEF